MYFLQALRDLLGRRVGHIQGVTSGVVIYKQLDSRAQTSNIHIDFDRGRGNVRGTIGSQRLDKYSRCLHTMNLCYADLCTTNGRVSQVRLRVGRMLCQTILHFLSIFICNYDNDHISIGEALSAKRLGESAMVEIPGL